MKRIVALLLVLSMIISMSSFVLAESGKEVAPKKSLPFGITEMVDENNRIVRVYERKLDDTNQEQLNRSFSSVDIYAETKELLLALGMEQDFIDNISEDDLKGYSNSESLVGTIAYTKTDAQNNVVYLEESAAIREAKVAREERAKKNKTLHATNGKKNALQTTIVQEKYEDSYMRLYHLVSYFGDGSFLYSTDARWLTMPFFRGKDSIGSCAQNGTVTYSTRSGYYEYDYMTLSTGGYVSSGRKNISSSYFKEAINGSFYGSAAIVDLPNNVNSGSLMRYYSNYKAHYQYQGHVNYPGQVSNFNSIGSYDHSKVTITVTPSVSIGLSGASPTIGLDIAGTTETRSAKVEVKYIP